MQVVLIESARNVVIMDNANSTEFVPDQAPGCGVNYRVAR